MPGHKGPWKAQQEFRHFTPCEVAMESKREVLWDKARAGLHGVFIVQQGNAVENGPKQGGKWGHSGSKDKCLDKTLKKTMELGRGDKEAFCFT